MWGRNFLPCPSAPLQTVNIYSLQDCTFAATCDNSSMTSIAINACLVLPMAVDAEGHVVERKRRLQFHHRSNFAVTGFALDTLRDVRIVIEVHKVCNMVHPHPLNRLFAFPRLSHLDDLRLGRSYKLMTAHAGLERRNIRVRSSSHTAMAILASNLILPRVFRVTKRDRLARTNFLPLTRRDCQHEEDNSNKKKINRYNVVT